MSPRTAAKQTTDALLATLWKKNLPLLRSRLAEIQEAARAAETGSLTPEQRVSAGSTAHKLAGSLGMFGYPRGTELARELEQCLDAPGAAKPAELAADIAAKIAALREHLAL